MADLEKTLIKAHVPRSIAEGKAAQDALEFMAAYRAVQLARRQAESMSLSGVVTLPRPVGKWESWAQELPFTLSPNQTAAVSEIVADLRQGKPMRRMLTGDVGYGKTAVFCVAAATIYEAGGRVAMLFPNETLAEQAQREIAEFWPSIRGDLGLVTGNTTSQNLIEKKWLVGTTALLFRDVGDFQFVVVDEQQKLGRDQREKLVGEGAHLLEATATCIPRSQALMQFGAIELTKLDQPPVEKYIDTQIRMPEHRRSLFQDVRKTLAEGNQVLIVYPKKGGDQDGGKSQSESNSEGIADVEAAYEAWQRLFGHIVRRAHGSRNEEENTQALADMRSGAASVLIATTVVEVGVNIPNLRRVVIVDPHRFGLSTLHQIRGRAARKGGLGHCDLLVLDVPKNPKSMERLQALVDTQDGFEIAARDLQLRGCGDLGADSSKQTGADDTILFGRPLQPGRLEEVADALSYEG